MYTEIGLLIIIVSAIICPIIARFKGRSVIGWFFLGILLDGIAIIIISCISSKKPKGDDNNEEKYEYYDWHDNYRNL